MKWLIKNCGKRALFALKNPRYSVSSLVRELTLSDEKFISRITGVSPWQTRKFMSEPLATPEFATLLNDAVKVMNKLRIESADLFAKKILIQYAAVRALEADCIVETGVANGVSSAYLLLALRKNGKGRLHSIGLNDSAFLPPGRDVGWLVPGWLRDRWTLHVGDATDMVPSLLSRLDPIDVFIHDSLHTYEHMTWEFETAYPALRYGGLLISDDALWNAAFQDFALRVGAVQASILRGVGLLQKGRG